MNFFRLQSAYLCPDLDCAAVGNCSTRCPACGNELGLLNLAGVLDRDPVRDEVRAVMGIFDSLMSEVIA